MDEINELSDRETISEEKKNQYLMACNKFKEHWKKGDRRTDKILMDMVNVYRDFVTQMIKDVSEKHMRKKRWITYEYALANEEITIADFDDKIKGSWKHCMAYMIIEIIVNNYNDEKTGMLETLPGRYGRMVAQWWNYVIKKRYIQDTSLVLQLKKQYIQEMENESSPICQMNKRIVNYIAGKFHSSINSKYIWQYWKQNINDIFEVIISIELGKFYNPEEILPDLNYIKEKIK